MEEMDHEDVNDMMYLYLTKELKTYIDKNKILLGHNKIDINEVRMIVGNFIFVLEKNNYHIKGEKSLSEKAESILLNKKVTEKYNEKVLSDMTQTFDEFQSDIGEFNINDDTDDVFPNVIDFLYELLFNKYVIMKKC